jgi:hypothetical protein
MAIGVTDRADRRIGAVPDDAVPDGAVLDVVSATGVPAAGRNAGRNPGVPAAGRSVQQYRLP